MDSKHFLRQIRCACRLITRWLIYVGIALCSLATVLGLFGHLHWTMDLMNHMRMHIVVGTLLAVVWMIWHMQRRWFVLAFASLVINLVIVQPWQFYVASEPRTVTQTDSFVSLLCWNVLASNQDTNGIVGVVRQSSPDLIVLVEYTESLASQLDHLRKDYPFHLESPRRDAFGIAVFSRKPCKLETFRIGTGNVPCICATIGDAKNAPLRLWAAHTYPPIGEMWRFRRRQLEELSALVAAYNDVPTVVCGDLNETPWGNAFRSLIDRADLADSSSGLGYQASWPTMLGPLGIPIDHVLVSRDVSVIERKIVRGIAGSDHRPVFVQLAVPKDSKTAP